jgi:hypothetical protein
MSSLSFKLTEDQRERIQAAIAGLTGEERHREASRLRSQILRLNPDCRKKDNASKAAHGRQKYHADLEASRRKGAEKKARRRRAAAGTDAMLCRRLARLAPKATVPAGPSKATDEAEPHLHLREPGPVFAGR